jgi:hypothetical protein
VSRQKKGDPIAELSIRIIDLQGREAASRVHQRAGQDSSATLPGYPPGTSASCRWPSSGPGYPRAAALHQGLQGLMTVGAAPDAGRRGEPRRGGGAGGISPAGAALYLLGPVRSAHACSPGPRRPRELVWLVLAGAGVAASLVGDRPWCPRCCASADRRSDERAFCGLSLGPSRTVVTRVLGRWS